MRAALFVLFTVAACDESREAAPPDAGASVPAVNERPLWSFGEESARTDTLPPALDTLAEWGDYHPGERTIAYAVDLNGDGEREYLARGHARVCGRAGCPMALFIRQPDGRYVDSIDGLVRGVYVTNIRNDGWPVLWLRVGGIDGGLFRFAFAGGSYTPRGTLSTTREAMAEEPPARVDSLLTLLNMAERR